MSIKGVRGGYRSATERPPALRQPCCIKQSAFGPIQPHPAGLSSDAGQNRQSLETGIARQIVATGSTDAAAVQDNPKSTGEQGENLRTPPPRPAKSACKVITIAALRRHQHRHRASFISGKDADHRGAKAALRSGRPAHSGSAVMHSPVSTRGIDAAIRRTMQATAPGAAMKQRIGTARRNVQAGAAAVREQRAAAGRTRLPPAVAANADQARISRASRNSPVRRVGSRVIERRARHGRLHLQLEKRLAEDRGRIEISSSTARMAAAKQAMVEFEIGVDAPSSACRAATASRRAALQVGQRLLYLERAAA